MGEQKPHKSAGTDLAFFFRGISERRSEDHPMNVNHCGGEQINQGKRLATTLFHQPLGGRFYPRLHFVGNFLSAESRYVHGRAEL